jgi:hypothetical protein
MAMMCALSFCFETRATNSGAVAFVEIVMFDNLDCILSKRATRPINMKVQVRVNAIRIRVNSRLRPYETSLTPAIRIPNGPGRQASFGAPNDGPVRGMHFGGLVSLGMESEYLGPDTDDCTCKIRL